MQRPSPVVITGVTRGLGRAMALGFAARGHTLLGCGRDPARVEAVGAELGEPHEVARLDVSTPAVETWAEDLLARHGPPRLLINNAGVINRPAELWSVPPEEFFSVLDVNLKGIYRVIRAFLPAMVERGSGVVVNLSSGWGRSTSPGVAPYCASKFGVEGLTRALAQELPAGMAAVALSPGVVDTDMLRSAWGETAGSYDKPERWAERAVPYILSLGPEQNGGSLTVP